MIRLRLPMLAPLSMRCSWKRRTSSGVAVSGERLSQAANRLQLEMWLRWVCGLSLRAAISSSIRWRSGLTVLVSLMGSSFLSEVCDTSILRKGLSTCHRRALDWLRASRLLPPRSGLERSDFVLWPTTEVYGNAGYISLLRSTGTGARQAAGENPSHAPAAGKRVRYAGDGACRRGSSATRPAAR